MADTRLIFLGDAALANGFRLAGFEVFPDASVDVLDKLLKQLQAARQAAFVVLDHRLADCDCQVLGELRNEGGRILITQVPPLTDPGASSSSVDERIRQLLGQLDHPA